MDLFVFCDLTHFSGLSNYICVFSLVSSEGIDYFWFLTLDFLYLDSEFSGLWKHLMQQ